MRSVVRVAYKFTSLSPVDRRGCCSSGLGQAGCLENSGIGLARHRNWGAPGPGKGGCEALEVWLGSAAPAQNQWVRGVGGGVAQQ